MTTPPAPLRAATESSTPSSQWRANGEPDPHAGHYDGERASLALGHMTDDELANGAFMNYDQRPPLEQILNRTPGVYMPIVWMTAVKDRIRWLSRALEKASAPAPVAHRPAEGWQPIETAENDSKARLVWCPEYKNIYAAVWDKWDCGWSIFGGGRLNETPSHWMPLPAPPTGEAK